MYYGNDWVYSLLLEDKHFSKHQAAGYIFRPRVTQQNSFEVNAYLPDLSSGEISSSAYFHWILE